jgi:AbrB family looped-hinge helix DNA binding protein
MRTTIDAAGRVTIPRSLRDELGYAPGMELELRAVNGRLELSRPSRVRVEARPHGPRFVADDAEPLASEDVRVRVDDLRARPIF